MSNLTPEVQPLRLFSYTRSANDDHCQRARFYSREWGGTGLTSVKESWNLVYGHLLHSALDTYAKTGAVDYAALRTEAMQAGLTCGFDQILCRDWANILEGQLRGFIKTVWSALLQEYTLVDSENWIIYDLPNGYRFRARQDLLLQSTFDGHYCYVDYKSTSSTKPQWIASWAKSIQLHTSMTALKRTSGLPIDRAIIIGFYKGYFDDKKNMQRSPFSYGYVNREFSMTPEYSYEYQRGRGWELFSPSEEFDGLAEWIDRMPTALLTEQFPRTAPIFIREDIADEWFAQQLIREEAVAEAVLKLKQATSAEDTIPVLRTYFKQNFSHCAPAFGFKCEFEPICWQPWINADPLGSGHFTRYEAQLDSE